MRLMLEPLQQQALKGLAAPGPRRTPEYYKKWKNRKGDFARIFLISDQRNKNGWRVTWDSIKQHADDFLGKPGIRYLSCEDGECDLDHAEGPSYESSIRKQEPYRVSTIVAVELDETTHTAYAVHEALDNDTAQRFRDFAKGGNVMHDPSLYVSPAVWPRVGEVEVVGLDPEGHKMIDAHGWRALHSAFVTNPAYGQDARIYASCHDKGGVCEHELLTADTGGIMPSTTVLLASLRARVLALRASIQWDESKHPRDSDGKFTSGGGGNLDTKTKKEMTPDERAEFDRKTRERIAYYREVGREDAKELLKIEKMLGLDDDEEEEEDADEKPKEKDGGEAPTTEKKKTEMTPEERRSFEHITGIPAANEAFEAIQGMYGSDKWIETQRRDYTESSNNALGKIYEMASKYDLDTSEFDQLEEELGEKAAVGVLYERLRIVLDEADEWGDSDRLSQYNRAYQYAMKRLEHLSPENVAAYRKARDEYREAKVIAEQQTKEIVRGSKAAVNKLKEKYDKADAEMPFKLKGRLEMTENALRAHLYDSAIPELINNTKPIIEAAYDCQIHYESIKTGQFDSASAKEIHDYLSAEAKKLFPDDRPVQDGFIAVAKAIRADFGRTASPEALRDSLIENTKDMSIKNVRSDALKSSIKVSPPNIEFGTEDDEGRFVPDDDLYITEEHTKQIAEVWDAMPPEVHKHAKNLRIIPLEGHGEHRCGGYWNTKDTIAVKIGPQTSKERLRNVIMHEAAHAMWQNMPDTQKQAFRELIDEIGNISPYAGLFKNKTTARKEGGSVWRNWQRYQFKDDPLKSDIYYNECHSELVASMYDMAYNGFPGWNERFGNIHRARMRIGQSKYARIFGSQIWGLYNTLSARLRLRLALMSMRAKLLALRAGSEWTEEDESKHPRADDGKWTKGGGSSAAKKPTGISEFGPPNTKEFVDEFNRVYDEYEKAQEEYFDTRSSEPDYYDKFDRYMELSTKVERMKRHKRMYKPDMPDPADLGIAEKVETVDGRLAGKPEDREVGNRLIAEIVGRQGEKGDQISNVDYMLNMSNNIQHAMSKCRDNFETLLEWQEDGNPKTYKTGQLFGLKKADGNTKHPTPEDNYGIERMRSGQAGLMLIKPLEWLKLADERAYHDYQSGNKSPHPLRRDSMDEYRDKLKKGTEFTIMHLDIKEDGEVYSHEGRHRAIAAYEAGIEKIPTYVISKKKLTDEQLAKIGDNNHYWLTADSKNSRFRATAKAVKKVDIQLTALQARIRTLKADWDESKHPRDDDGKFTSGGGGSGGKTLSSEPRLTQAQLEKKRATLIKEEEYLALRRTYDSEEEWEKFLGSLENEGLARIMKNEAEIVMDREPEVAKQIYKDLHISVSNMPEDMDEFDLRSTIKGLENIPEKYRRLASSISFAHKDTHPSLSSGRYKVSTQSIEIRIPDTGVNIGVGAVIAHEFEHLKWYEEATPEQNEKWKKGVSKLLRNRPKGMTATQAAPTDYAASYYVPKKDEGKYAYVVGTIKRQEEALNRPGGPKFTEWSKGHEVTKYMHEKGERIDKKLKEEIKELIASERDEYTNATVEQRKERIQEYLDQAYATMENVNEIFYNECHSEVGARIHAEQEFFRYSREANTSARRWTDAEIHVGDQLEDFVKLYKEVYGPD